MSLLHKILLGWLLLINLATITTVFYDKRQARLQGWRIPERQLFSMAALGGIIGLLLGMKLARHKTQKGSFLTITGLLILWNLACISGLLFALQKL